MEWTSTKPRTEIIAIEDFWYKYGDDMVKKLNGKTPIEVEQTDEFIIEAIGIYEKKKWYEIFKKKELMAVELAYLRYAVID
jgi:hypothetical protein